MKKVKYFIFSLICLFSCSIVFAENEVVIKSITPVYDETSTVVVTEENGVHSVTFNDKNQSVKYNIVIENTADYDMKINSVEPTKPIKEFIEYKLEGINKDDVLKSNETKELVVSLETIKKEGWGRNFEEQMIISMPFQRSNTIINPNTASDKISIVVLICGGLIACAMIYFYKKKAVFKTIVLLLTFGSIITIVCAKENNVLQMKINVSYESQNVMKPSGYEIDIESGESSDKLTDYWVHSQQIQKIYIKNELIEMTDYVHKFDVSEAQNGRVMAYLVNSEPKSLCYSLSGEQANCYDLYLQADGVIYPNPDASGYFAYMVNLDSISYIEGLDTSNVTNMSGMFYKTGYNSSNFALDVSRFDTSRVTNMSGMFYETGYNSTRLNTTITITNPNTTSYDRMFFNVATQRGSKIRVNYTGKTSYLVDQMIATKSTNSNVVKGSIVDLLDSLEEFDEEEMIEEPVVEIPVEEPVVEKFEKEDIEKIIDEEDFVIEYR